MHALMLASSQRLLARTHASAALDAGSHRDGFKLDLAAAAALAYSPWVRCNACITSGRRGRRPAPATNRAARLVVAVVCVTRERLRLLRVTQASCLPVTNPGLASQLAPGLRGRAFCLVWFRVNFFLMLRNREQPQHNPTSPTRPQKPQSSAFTTRKKKYKKRGILRLQ